MKYSVMFVPALLAGFITGCGGSGGSTVNVSGSVTAVNGEVAFYSPGIMETLIAGIIGKPSFAAITGETSVGAGVTINLIEVDNNGTQVGAVITSATTDVNGNYSINAPEGFVASSKYVVRAVGTSVTEDARVDTLTPSISPTSDIVSSVIASNSLDLAALSATEISEIQAAIEDVVENTDATTSTVDSFRTDILAATADSEEASNLLASTVAAGQICGTVKDSSGALLENIRIVVRDFGNWTTRAKTKTAADGSYCVNVPRTGDADTYISGKTLNGEYILGALNFTGSSFAASQWWTSTSSTVNGTGGANGQFKAEKITVGANTTTVTKDMVLDKDGARVTGTVTGPNSASVEGMRVVIRNYDTFKPLASAKVKSNNIYRINVKATDYLISFRNKTRHPYASEIYRSGTDGVNNRNLASRETMTANQSNTYNAELAAGVVISGIVKDNDGTAVSGQVVYMNNVDGGRIEALRTNKSGKFRMWVNPRLDLSDTTAGTYKVWSRGQFQMANTNGDDDATPTHYKLSQNTGLTFDAQTVQVKGVLMSSDASPVPVPAAVMRLTIPTVGTDLQVSAGDGSFVLYTSGASTAHKMFVRWMTVLTMVQEY